MAKQFQAPKREEPFYPSAWDAEFNSGDEQAKASWPRRLDQKQQLETARATYAVWKAQGMLPKYDNMDDYRAFFLEDWQRGYRYRLAILEKNHADQQRFGAHPAFAGREVARITIENEPVEVGSVHNRSLSEKGIWMLQCVECHEYHVRADEEMDYFDDTDGYEIFWVEAPPEEERRGGQREGAGRKQEGASYEQGYQAGYKAGRRFRLPYLVQVAFKYNPERPMESGCFDTFDTENDARLFIEEMKQDARFDYAALHCVDKAGYTLHREIISK